MKPSAILSLSLLTTLFLGAGCVQNQTNANENTNTQNGNINTVVVNDNEDTNESDVDTSDLALSEVEGWQTYTNEEYGFSFRYPEKWEVQAISETTLGIVSPELKQTLASGPNSIEVADLFIVTNIPATEATYITNDLVDSLEAIEKSGEIKELIFSSNNNKAKFIDHNDFADVDQYHQYIRISEGIITSAYSINSPKKDIFEKILASLSIL